MDTKKNATSLNMPKNNTPVQYQMLQNVSEQSAQSSQLSFDIKLDTNNWKSWFPAFKRVIGYRAPVIIEGKTAEEINMPKHIWCIINDRGVSYIQSAITATVSDALPETTPGDAHALFKQLETLYGSEGLLSEIEVVRAFMNIEKAPTTLKEFTEWHATVQNKFNDLTRLSPNIDAKVLSLAVLSLLPPELHHNINHINGM